MRKSVKLLRAKPNPVGKDKILGIPKAEQLLGEWIDIKNTGTEAIKLSDIFLSHTKFNNKCEMIGTDCFWIGRNNFLHPERIIRVHTGNISDEHLMRQEDKINGGWCSFANRDNFVLNNRCGDILTLTWRDFNSFPQAETVSFEANQPEGAILVRVGNNLVPKTSKAE